MAYLFPSPEWARAFQEALNADPAYREAAATWEVGAVCFVILTEDPPGLPKKIYLWLDLHRGECRAAALVDPEQGHAASFLISAEYEQWVQILQGRLDPIRAIWMGKLKVRGDLSLLLRYMRAAREMLACAQRVPTRFGERA